MSESLALSDEEAEEAPSPSNPKLRVDVFLRLFRIEELSDGAKDKIKSILNRLVAKQYAAGSIILREGDADAANEMLVFTHGRVAVGEQEQLVLPSPFYIGEERVLKGSWPTATFQAKTKCRCYSLTSETVADLVMKGGFDLERILRLRAFERTLAMHGLHVSVLRDAVFVKHFMSFLVERYSAENLKFLVEMMRFKRDVTPKDSFETVYARFSVIWDAYLRPWDDMSNVCALECPPETVNQVTQAKEEACKSKSAKTLAAVLDPLAIKVKSVVENDLLPAFVKSMRYVVFLRERFPHVERDHRETMSSAIQWTVGPTKVLKHLMEGVATDQHSDETDHHHHQRRRSVSAKQHSQPNRFAIESGDIAAAPAADYQSAGLSGDKSARSARPALQLKLSNMAQELERLDREAEDAAADVEVKKKGWQNSAASRLRRLSKKNPHAVQPAPDPDDVDISTAFDEGALSSPDEDGSPPPSDRFQKTTSADSRCVLC